MQVHVHVHVYVHVSVLILLQSLPHYATPQLQQDPPTSNGVLQEARSQV